MLKTKTERLLAFVVVFLAGCEASRLANIAVPPAHAGEPVQRWEYACMRPGTNIGGIGPEEIANEANTFGVRGWELVASSYSANLIWCFKRPLGAAASAPASAE